MPHCTDGFILHGGFDHDASVEDLTEHAWHNPLTASSTVRERPGGISKRNKMNGDKKGQRRKVEDSKIVQFASASQRDNLQYTTPFGATWS